MVIYFKRIIFFVLFANYLHPNLFAQQTDLDTIKYACKIANTAFYSKGNIERLLLSNNADFSYSGHRIGLKSSNTYLYGTFAGLQTENDLLSKNILFILPKSKIYYFALLVLESNYRRKINFRHQEGVGIGLNILRNKLNTIKISSAFIYEKSIFRNAKFIDYDNNNSNIIEAYRFIFRMYGKHYLIDKKIILMYENWLQPAINNLNNYRWHSDVNIEVPINKYFSLRTAINFSFEKIVLENVKQNDLFITFGMSFKNF